MLKISNNFQFLTKIWCDIHMIIENCYKFMTEKNLLKMSKSDIDNG